MKKVSVKIIAALCVVFIALLPSCVKKPEETPYTPQSELRDNFEPSGEMDEAARILAERHEKYSKDAALYFADARIADESDFKTEEIAGGVKIIKYIGDGEQVIIPEKIGDKNVIAIGENAFENLSVTELFIPDCIDIIEKGAVTDCESLEIIRLPFLGNGDEITHFGYIFGADSYENHALSVPVRLDVVILGEKAARIEENAFARCKTISSVIVSSQIESIDNFAFYECKDLVYFDANNLVKQIGEYAFGYCESLFAPTFAKAERIGRGALYGCNALRSIAVPFVGESETENRFIGHVFGAESADHNDEYVPKSLYSVILTSDCEEIPDRAFASCAYISRFILCDGITSIGTRAFYGCRSVIDIEIPDSVTEIGDDAFFGCDNLVSVKLGDGIKSLGMQAFYGCLDLAFINIPDSLTEIKQSTFALCESLKEIDLNNVKTVRKDAFSGCKLELYPDISGIQIIEDGNLAIVKPEMDTTEAIK